MISRAQPRPQDPGPDKGDVNKAKHVSDMEKMAWGWSGGTAKSQGWRLRLAAGGESEVQTGEGSGHVIDLGGRGGWCVVIIALGGHPVLPFQAPGKTPVLGPQT